MMWCTIRYVDGYGSCGRTTGTVPQRSSPVFIGAASASLLNPLCGAVHDVRVYSKALTLPELRGLWGEMSHKLQVCTRGGGGQGRTVCLHTSLPSIGASLLPFLSLS
jgi:hypothetical protein